MDHSKAHTSNNVISLEVLLVQLSFECLKGNSSWFSLVTQKAMYK